MDYGHIVTSTWRLLDFVPIIFFSYVSPKSLYVPTYVIIVQRQNNLISNDIKNEWLINQSQSVENIELFYVIILFIFFFIFKQVDVSNYKYRRIMSRIYNNFLLWRSDSYNLTYYKVTNSNL